MPDELDDACALPPGAAQRYRDLGFVHLEGVLAPATLERYREACSASVAAFNTLDLPMQERDTYQKAFLQVMNLWTRDETVRRFVFGRRLARIAAQLMDVAGVRLYHDQALFKEPGGGHTPWHADQYYWPLASDRCCTAWVPLQETPLPMGPLAFAAGSHRLALGDASFHAGWTFHRAGENRTPRMREVMTVIYMDAQMRLAAPRNPNQQADRDTWCPGAVVGERIETRLNPVLFP